MKPGDLYINDAIEDSSRLEVRLCISHSDWNVADFLSVTIAYGHASNASIVQRYCAEKVDDLMMRRIGFVKLS